MDKAEIKAKMESLAQELANLSNEICKTEGSLACRLSVEITNVMGGCQIKLNASTSGKATLPQILGMEVAQKPEPQGEEPLRRNLPGDFRRQAGNN